MYGTLRNGASHAWLLDEFAERREPAWTHGVACNSGAGYPVAKFGDEAVLHGELVWLRRDSAADALHLLDEYEGDAFRRVVIDVTTRDGVTRAYAYESAEPGL